MPWTEEQINELIQNVRRDFALARAKPEFWLKLQNRSISRHLAESIINKKSYIVEYDHLGSTIGFFDARSQVFVAWKSDYPTGLKTCFIANGGLAYLKRQYDFKLIWTPK